MSWLLGSVRESRLWAFFVFQILFFFFKGVGIAQLTGGATEKEPGTLRSCKKAIANLSFGEKYIQLTVSIFCFERGRKSSYSNYLPTLQPYRLVL